ncbi:serine hydrolase [Phenylobacterium sp.]|uniref:serine hydrolase domain-containing protein n=1 Tax=Phenylobacterium sp. TaxID=1871053 RepID=UPI00286C4A0A|nr:serine hydrolase [Phenylobacterium sp.]
MTPILDRRTVWGGLTALLLPAARARAATDPLARVLAPASGPPMACAGIIARRGDGSAAIRAAAGVALGPAGERAFTLDQPFRVASISKMVAASVFLPLAMRTGLDLDADASDLLGFRLRHPAHPDVAITPRMLLSHTSGLRNGPSYPVPLGRALSEAFVVGGRHYDAGGWFGPLEHRPGVWFAYADVNFALVAQMLERRACQRFDMVMREALFRPMGLDIGYNWSGVSQGRRAHAAAGLRLENGRWSPQVDAQVVPAPRVAFSRAPESPRLEAPILEAGDYRLGDNGMAFSPQGGLRLSVTDMDRLARMYAAGGRWNGRQILPRAALEAMQARAWTLDPARPNGEEDGVFQSYGLGCETPVGRSGPKGDAYFGADTDDWRGHFGDAYGWITAMFWNRRDGRTLVYALNGMPETGRPPARGSCLTAPEEALIALALRAWQKGRDRSRPFAVDGSRMTAGAVSGMTSGLA